MEDKIILVYLGVAITLGVTLFYGAVPEESIKTSLLVMYLSSGACVIYFAGKIIQLIKNRKTEKIRRRS